MPIISGKKITLWKAAARFHDLLYIVATMDDLMGREIPHSTFLSLDADQWRSVDGAPWATAGACVVHLPSERFIAVSEDGDVMTYVGGNRSDESISPKPRTIRAVSAIGGRAYACGMFRQVYVRTAEGEWNFVGAPPPRQRIPSGFEAIAGFDESDMYAVGWRGEIWQRKNGEWRQHESPVNVILTGVCCAADGFVYICGQNGTIVKGRNDSWSVIDHELPRSDLWDIHAFGDRIFSSSFTDLIEIRDNSVEPVDFGDDEPGTCHRLTSAEGVLWSVGSDDVFAFNGEYWRRIV